MKLVNKEGNEISSRSEKHEEISNEFGSVFRQVTQQVMDKMQLMGIEDSNLYQQVASMAVNEINQIIIFKLVEQSGKGIEELIGERDINYLSTQLNNALSFKDKSEGQETHTQKPN